MVVDQFEEVFTLCRDSDERERFLGMLLNALDAGSGLRVVIGVRADFYGHCAQHPGLAAALRDAGLLVGPMNAAELREAVVKPAAAAGLIVERDLTARIIAEVGREPGSLPLMSHALLETWRRRHGRALTEAMYEAAGGLHGAIAATAEAFYASLSPSQTAAARRILLRLINPGEGAQDTRRSADRAELDSCDGSDTATVVEALATARLLTLDGDTVDLAHEALISGWPRYRLWIEEDREHLKIHRRLTEAARTWEEHRRDPGALYRGTRLSAACDAFAGADREGLTGLESAFLDTSRAARDHEIHVAARAARRLRALIAALSVMLVLAVTAGLIAAAQSRASERSRRRAVAAQQVALSRQLAAASSSLIGKNDDAVMLLAAQAYRTSPTEEARTALTAADALPMRRTFAGSVSPVTSMAFSHDGRTLIWGKDDRTLLRADTTDDRSPSLLAAPPDAVTSMALGPDERTLVTTDESRVVHELDLATGESLAPARFDSRITSQWLAPDGRTIVETRPRGPAASPGRIPTVTVRDIVSGKAHTTDLTGAGQPSGTGDVTVLGLSPDHRVLATMENPEVITLRDAASGHLRLRLDSRGFAFTPSTPVVFSPDGRLLAASGDDGNVRLWNTVTGDVSRVLDATSALTAAATSTDNADRVGDPTQVTALAFSPDGNTLAGGVGDGTIWLWDTLTNYSGIALTGYSSSVTELAFTPDSRTLASGAADGTVRLWPPAARPPEQLRSGHRPVRQHHGARVQPERPHPGRRRRRRRPGPAGCRHRSVADRPAGRPRQDAGDQSGVRSQQIPPGLRRSPRDGPPAGLHGAPSCHSGRPGRMGPQRGWPHTPHQRPHHAAAVGHGHRTLTRRAAIHHAQRFRRRRGAEPRRTDPGRPHSQRENPDHPSRRQPPSDRVRLHRARRAGLRRHGTQPRRPHSGHDRGRPPCPVVGHLHRPAPNRTARRRSHHRGVQPRQPNRGRRSGERGPDMGDEHRQSPTDYSLRWTDPCPPGPGVQPRRAHTRTPGPDRQNRRLENHPARPHLVTEPLVRCRRTQPHPRSTRHLHSRDTSTARMPCTGAHAPPVNGIPSAVPPGTPFAGPAPETGPNLDLS